MSDIFIDLDRTGSWFVLYTPYNQLFVSELKARVPSPNRRWVAEDRAWCVSRTYWDTAQVLLRKHYPEGHFQMGPTAEAADVVLDTALDDARRSYMRICASRRVPSEPPPDMAALIAMRAS